MDEPKQPDTGQAQSVPIEAVILEAFRQVRAVGFGEVKIIIADEGRAVDVIPAPRNRFRFMPKLDVNIDVKGIKERTDKALEAAREARAEKSN